MQQAGLIDVAAGRGIDVAVDAPPRLRLKEDSRSCSKNSSIHTNELPGAGALNIDNAGVGMQSTSATKCDSVSGDGSRWRMNTFEGERVLVNGFAPTAQRKAKCCTNGGETRRASKRISLISSTLRGGSTAARFDEYR